MPSTLHRITQLVHEALDHFDDPGMSTTALVRKALRVATLRNDFVNAMWLKMESEDLTNKGGKGDSLRRWQEYSTKFSKDEWERVGFRNGEAYIARRSIGDGQINGMSVEHLENRVLMLEREAVSLAPPSGLAPVDLYFMSQEMIKARSNLTIAATDTRALLARVKRDVHAFLVETEHQLEFGAVNADIFERTREFVDGELAGVSAQALEQLTSAYRRVQEGDTEALSHSLTSCRRVLKSVADSIYPARDEPV